MTTSAPQQSRSKRGGCVLKIFFGMILLLILTGGGAYILLSAWKWYPLPAFHESWSPEERLALSRFDAYLTTGGLDKDFLAAQVDMADTLDKLRAVTGGERKSNVEKLCVPTEQRFMALYMSHAVGSPMRRELAAIAESGSADRQPLKMAPSGTTDTPARFAIYMGHIDAAKALIRHGADPNFHEPELKESLLSSLLSNKSLRGAHPLPLNERLAMADWLVEQGADVRSLRESLRYAPMLSRHEAGSTLRWLHTHNFGTEPYENGAPVYEFMYHPAERDFWKEMFASGRLSVNDTRGNRTPLQVICSCLDSAEQVAMLDWLLQRGASPVISAQQEGLFPREQPLELLLSSFSLYEENSEEQLHAFRAMRLLQRYGATLPGETLPQSDKLHDFLLQRRKLNPRERRSSSKID